VRHRRSPRPSRTLRAARGDIPFLLILAIMFGGFLLVRIRPEHWLRGVLIIGGDMILAGLIRLVLTDRRAGILAVRSRAFDVICYVGLGVLVITFGIALPG
jgi:hypothetical protein